MKNKGVIFLVVACGTFFSVNYVTALSLPTDCPPVQFPGGLDVLCEMTDAGYDTKECPTSPMNYTGSFPKGTILRYTCKSKMTDANARAREHWSLKNYLLCKCKGKWKGLKELKEFAYDCTKETKESSTNGKSSKLRKVVKVVLAQPNRPNVSVDLPEESEADNDELPIVTISSFTSPEYQRVALGYHNLYRRMHRSPTVKLNDTLMKVAQDWADHEVTQDKLEDIPGKRTNVDNIFEIIGEKNMSKEAAVKLAMENWYQSIAEYDWSKPRASAFSQIVWKDTTDIGVGVSSLGDKTIVVCTYWPPGNVYLLNEKEDGSDRGYYFKKNVLPFATGMVFLTRSGPTLALRNK